MSHTVLKLSYSSLRHVIKKIKTCFFPILYDYIIIIITVFQENNFILLILTKMKQINKRNILLSRFLSFLFFFVNILHPLQPYHDHRSVDGCTIFNDDFYYGISLTDLTRALLCTLGSVMVSLPPSSGSCLWWVGLVVNRSGAVRMETCC